jgi:CheY-like chemotaxis protein
LFNALLDGYETTRRIREIEKEKNVLNPFPIVANSLREDEERCISAGMYGNLTKPFQVDKGFLVFDR